MPAVTSQNVFKSRHFFSETVNTKIIPQVIPSASILLFIQQRSCTIKDYLQGAECAMCSTVKGSNLKIAASQSSCFFQHDHEINW